MIDLDPRVLQLIGDAGDHQQEIAGGVRLFHGDSGLDVLRQDDVFEVRPWGKGVTDEPDLTGAARSILETYLVLHYGNAWRLARGWPMLRLAERSEPLPPGFVFTAEQGHRGNLVIEGPPRRVLGRLLPGTARRLARALTVPLGDLIASFRDPDGLPAFGPRPGGPQ